MKKYQLRKQCIAAIIALFCIHSYNYAQDVLEFIPAELTPHDTGYYKKGIDVWKDGILHHYDSCTEEFEYDWLHFESGEYNGFTYDRALVMPTCTTKDNPEEGMHVGFVQLVKAYYPMTESTYLLKL